MKMQEKSGIYKIECTKTGKCYVGSSHRIYRRWLQHRKDLRGAKHFNRRLQRAWNKHTEEAFAFSVLEECERAMLEAREQWHIDALKPDYNIILQVGTRCGPEVSANRAAAARARAALITHCPKGHEYNDANTYRNGKGSRICRVCNADRAMILHNSLEGEKRSAALAYRKENYQKNREARLASMAIYTAVYKEEKRAYDKAHRAHQNALRNERRKTETFEQREKRLRQKMESYYRSQARKKSADNQVSL